MYSVDIDVGGSLIDGIFSDGHGVVCTVVQSSVAEVYSRHVYQSEAHHS